MDHIYSYIYVVICVILYIVLFFSDKIFYLLFETKYNNIVDHTNPEYTGGVTYEFNPFWTFQ